MEPDVRWRPAHRRKQVLLACFIAGALVSPGVLGAWPSPATSVCDATCQAAQQTALTILYASTGGANWTRPVATSDGVVVPITQWGFAYPIPGLPLPIHCFWVGVFCCDPRGYITNATGFSTISTGFIPCDTAYGVASLVLTYNNMVNRIPDAVWPPLATSLTRLELGNNALTGSLPAASPLVNLEYLGLSSNQMGGTIPPALTSSLTRLALLRLDANMLTGAIPPLGAMSKLESFSVSDNMMTGTLPVDWFSSTALRWFDASYNSMTGTVPDISVNTELFGPLNTEFSLRLNGNGFSGALPPTMFRIRYNVLGMADNNFTMSVSGLSVILARVLEGSNNSFYGTLPIVEGTVAFPVEVFDIHQNNVTGNWFNMSAKAMTELNLDDNEITGPLPVVLDAPRLQTLSLHNTLMQHGDGVQNSRKEQLPEYLTFNLKSLVAALDVPNLACYAVIAAPDHLPALTDIVMDSRYFSRQNCTCVGLPGTTYTLKVHSNGTGTCEVVVQTPPLLRGLPYSVIIATTISSFLVLVVLLLLAFLWFRLRRERSIKAGGPPATKGQPLVMVCTDVESSTELWEWNNGIMMESLAIHDRLIRANLGRHFGYEVATEGDAFILAFWEPLDAVAWCLSTQHALLAAEWPEALFSHHAAAVRLRPDAEDGSPGPASPTSSQQAKACRLMFKGLRVRMSVATGVCQEVKLNKTSKTLEYSGRVPQLCRALAEAPHGGQVVLEDLTMAGIKNRLAELYTRSRCEAKTQALTSRSQAGELSRCASEVHASKRFHPSLEMARAESLRPDLGISGPGASAWNSSQALPGTPMAGQASIPMPGTPLTNQPSSPMPGTPDPMGQTQVGLLSGGIEESALRSAAVASQRKRRRRWAGGLLGCIRGWLPRTGGIGEEQKQDGKERCTMVDMGEHILAGVAGTYNILQALVPGLEDRAWMLPPLRSRVQVHAGFFEAPGALTCPPNLSATAVLPEVTLVFCAIDGLADMKAANDAATELALTHYRDCIRSCLNSSSGYECQEADGDFMLAFANNNDAVIFSLMISRLTVLTWANKRRFGPRVRIGLYQGIPNKICPHATSGRADYFGNLVNRAARYCHSAAHGGQVLMPISIARDFVTFCSGRSMSLEESGSAVRLGLLGSASAAFSSFHHRGSSAGSAVHMHDNPLSRQAPSEHPDVQELRSSPHRKQSFPAASSGQPWAIASSTAVQQPPALKVFGRQQRSIAMASATSPLSNQELPLVQHLGPNARPSILSQGLASLEQPASNPLFRDGSGGDMPPKAKASKSARDLRAIIKGGLQSDEELAPRHSKSRSIADIERPVQTPLGLDSSMGWAHIVHCGEWRLKGVNSDLAAIQMLPAQLAGRMFPSHLSSSKAKQVSPPKGLQVILQLPSQGPTQGLGNVQNPRRSSRVTMKEAQLSFDI